MKLNKGMRIKEEGAIIKKGFAGISIALGYPNSYYVGMSSLGYQSMYAIFNADGRVVCERFFVEESSIMVPRTIESNRKITDFNVIAFSISYELDAVNILRALKLAGLNIRAKERSRFDSIIIVGGSYVSINPIPLMEFCDVLCIGDGEALAPIIIDVIVKSKSKDEALEHFSSFNGFLVPRYYKMNLSVKPLFVNNNSFSVLVSKILTKETEFSNSYLIEIMRGCLWRCNFCWVGSFYKPCRIHNIEKIMKAISLLNKKPQKKVLPTIGLIAASSSDHPQFISLVDNINKMGYKKVSFSSLRCSELNSSYTDIIKKNQIKSITLAPETASKRLQSLINKKIDNKQLIDLCKNLANAGVKNLKLYFIIGLPQETAEDLLDSVNLIKEINDVVKNRCHLNVSLNYWVPKPFTNFQYLPMFEQEILVEKSKMIKKKLKSIKGLTYAIMKSETAYYEAILSLGGVESSILLEKILESRSSWRTIVRENLLLYKGLLFDRKGVRSCVLNLDYVK